MVCVFSRFSRKKAQVDILKVMQKSIDVQLRTYVNHLQTLTLAFEALRQQHVEIIELLKENKKHGQ
jgi:hypothetical protein